MSFGAPWLLILLVVPAGIVLLGWWAERRRAAMRTRYAGVGRLGALGQPPRYRRARIAILTIAATLLVIAAARPQIGTHQVALERAGTDVLVALDVSLSMGATDVPPTRLDRAKAAIQALIDRLQGDRVGLVTFAGDAQLRFPLTTDLVAASEVVQSVTLKDGGLQGGTDIGSALRQAARSFSTDKTRGKVLLLVSDGEDLGTEAAQAAGFSREQNVILDTLGVGTTQPTPLYVIDPRTGKQSPRTDPNTGQPVTTTANPDALRALAATNGGRFYDGNSDDFAAALAAQIDQLQKTRFAGRQGELPTERYQGFLGAALALLTIEFLLPLGIGHRGRAAWRALARLRPPATNEEHRRDAA
jgi:Ca-activated chloride channel family protein